MQNRHLNEMMRRLENVADFGYEEFYHVEIRRWYNIDRINKNTWRDIRQKWQEITDENDTPKLLCGENPGYYLFVHGIGLISDESSEKEWLRPIDDFC